MIKVYRRPHRAKKRRPIVKSQSFWLVIFSLAFVSLVCYALFFSDIFMVKKTSIEGNKDIPTEVISGVVEPYLLKGKSIIPPGNIFFVDMNRIIQELSDVFPKIAEVRISQKFPHTLTIIVRERDEKAQFCTKSDLQGDTVAEKCFLLDDGGIVFEENKEHFSLPIIKGGQGSLEKISLGSEIIKPQFLTKILYAVKGIEEKSAIRVTETVIVSEERINIKTAEGWDIYLDPKKNIDWQITKLAAVLEEYLPPSKREDLIYIELRFGNLAPFKKEEPAE